MFEDWPVLEKKSARRYLARAMMPAGMSQNRHIRRRIAGERMRAPFAQDARFSRWPIVLLAFLAIFIQSFVVQTHIHFPKNAGVSQSVSLTTLAKALISGPAAQTADDRATAPRDKYPINEDPSNCPLCQEVAHSGQFVQSASVLAFVPAWISVHFIPFAEALPSLSAASHSWQTRAPPRI
jgi:hypothetical protein